MLFKLIMVLVVGLIARSFSEDAPVMSSSDAAVTKEGTAGSDDQQDSTAVSEEADLTAASEKADSTAVSEEAESSTSVDNVNEKDSATPESSNKSEDKAEKASESNDQKREVDEHQEKDDNHAETPKGEGETEQTEDTAVELNRTCIISNATHWSWLVKIVDKESGKQVCTGTLITDEDVLVPASCFMENTTQDVPESFYSLPAEILAIAGGGMDTDCMQIRNVSSIYPHKGYFENSEEHDYAFLKISPEFDVDDDDIPDIRYHLNVINSEGGLVNIHNNGPFCESPYFVDDGMNAKVSDEIHLLGMRIEDCMMIWNCSADFDTCLSYLHPASHACLKPLTPRKCGPRDKGAPLVCDEVLLGYLHQCDGELPMIFRGLNKAIKFLELEEDHVQRPGYMGRHY